MRPKRAIRWLLLVVALAGLAWLGWRAYRATRSLQLALQDLDRIQLLSAQPSLDMLPTLGDDLAMLETHLTDARAAAAPLLFVAPYLGWVPQYGPTIASAPALLSIGVDLAGAGCMGIEMLGPVATSSPDGELLAGLVQALDSGQAQLALMRDSIADAERLAAGIHYPLHPKLQGKAELLQRLLPLVSSGSQLAMSAPELLGAQGSRTYLILAQNSHELRATGGFISGAGIIRLENGEIRDLKIGDSYSVDNWQQPHPRPPAALSEQMGAQLWLLRDSNWSPDFPSSATVARALYEQDQGIATDGAIAIDLEAVRLLVQALGPLEIPGIAQPVTGANVIEQMKLAWASPAGIEGTGEGAAQSDWWINRKDFMGELMLAALTKLQEGQAVSPVALAQALMNMLNGRHLQISVDDTQTSEILATRGWDGAIRAPAAGDFLAVIDSNVGFNKANSAIRQQIRYEVEAGEEGNTAELTLRYEHSAQPLPADQACDRTPRYGDSYDDLIRRCYWDYLRVYTPGGSQLVSSEGLNRVVTETGESNTIVFSGDFVVRPGETQTITLRYLLPSHAVPDPYRVTVRMQAGTVSTPLQVTYGDCRWETDLNADLSFECTGGGS